MHSGAHADHTAVPAPAKKPGQPPDNDGDKEDSIWTPRLAKDLAVRLTRPERRSACGWANTGPSVKGRLLSG